MYKFPKDPVGESGTKALRCIIGIHFVKNIRMKRTGAKRLQHWHSDDAMLNQTLSASPIQKSWDAAIIVLASRFHLSQKQIDVPWNLHWFILDLWWVWCPKRSLLFVLPQFVTIPCHHFVCSNCYWLSIFILSREAGHQRDIENECGQSALLQDFFGSS